MITRADGIGLGNSGDEAFSQSVMLVVVVVLVGTAVCYYS